VEGGRSWKAGAEGLPGRTARASRDRAALLGIERRTKQIHLAWRDPEDEVLRAGVEAGESWGTITEKLPGRNKQMVRGRALRLGIERRGKKVHVSGTEAEDDFFPSGSGCGRDGGGDRDEAAWSRRLRS
jgi:hypothetical protein